MSTITLPSYLRPGYLGEPELVLHCTWVQDHDLCPQKFWLFYGQGVEAVQPRPALVYGSAVHAGLRARYEAERDKRPWSQEAINGAIASVFAETPQPEGEWRNEGRAQALLEAYGEEHPASPWEVLGVEEKFEALVGIVEHAGRNYRVILAGTRDLVVLWHGGLWVVDHKTAQDWGAGDSNSHLDEGRMSFQFRGYAWAQRGTVCGNDRTLGTIGNYLISRKPYATDRAPSNGRAQLPRNQFHQEAFPFDDRQLDEWQQECLGVATEILREHHADSDRGTGFRRHRGACGHWGRCEFYEYCEASPEEREGLLQSTVFRARVGWE